MIALVLGLVLAGSPEAAPVEAGPPAVQVTVAGAAGEVEGLLRALPEFLDELGTPIRFTHVDGIDLDTVVSPTDAPSPAPARVWIDVVEPTRARIIVIDRSYERVLVRTIALEGGLDEVARDEIGYIVEASVEALLAGGQIGIERAVAAEQLGVGEREAEPAPEPRGPGPMAELALGYGVRAWGPVAPLHGPVIDVGVGAAFPELDLGGALEMQFLVPVVVRGEPFSLALMGTALRGLVRADLSLGGRWSFDVAVGGGVDLVHERPRADAGGARAFAARTRVVGDLALRLGPGLHFGRARDEVVLRLDATLDLAIGSYRYLTADTREVVFDPWVPRPGLRFTIGWSRRRYQVSKHAG